MAMAIGYLRRSKVSNDSPGAVSASDQEAAIRRMAGADIELIVDWGMSGGKRNRPGWLRLREAVKSGQVSTVFSYDFSRLGRDLSETLDFLAFCEGRGTTVLTAKEGELTNLSATQSLTRDILGRINQWQRELAEEKSRESNVTRRARGDAMGSAAFGSKFVRGEDKRVVLVPDESARATVAAVLEAYREAGSFLGACKILNGTPERAAVPAPLTARAAARAARGRAAGNRESRWWTRTVARIVAREAPELLPALNGMARRGRAGDALLSKLLQCHCGSTMTPRMTGGGGRQYRSYYCARGAISDRANHPRVDISEHKLLPYIQAEAAHLRTPEAVLTAEDEEAARANSQAKLDRAHELYIAGDIDKPRYEAEKARHGAAIDAIDAQAAAVDWPALDWSWPEAELAAVLRAIFIRVELNADMTPARAIWRLPEYRA
jgi:DNA invertase Pin-like site-specific DNA recombinase